MIERHDVRKRLPIGKKRAVDAMARLAQNDGAPCSFCSSSTECLLRRLNKSTPNPKLSNPSRMG